MIFVKGGAVQKLIADVNGGVPPYNFSWSNGQSDSCLITPAPADYVLSVTDASFCSTEAQSVKVDENLEPFRLDTFFLDNISCNGTNDGCATAVVSGGSSNYRFHFSNGEIWQNPGDSVTICGLSPGNYRVTITDLVHGCTSASGLLALNQPDPLFFRRDSIEDVNCFGNEDGAIYTTATGGTPPYSYSWLDAQQQLVGTNPDLLNVPAGQYTGQVTDFNGCTATVSGTVPSAGSLIRDTLASIQHVACRGENSGAISLVHTGRRPSPILQLE